jgi:hypothetical protein
VRVVHHDERVILVSELADLVQLRDVSVHREDAVGCDQPKPCAGSSPSCASSSFMSPFA